MRAALVLEGKIFDYITEKRRGKLRHKKLNDEILVVYITSPYYLQDAFLVGKI